jgi:hypothetical protein
VFPEAKRSEERSPEMTTATYAARYLLTSLASVASGLNLN